MTFQYTVYIFLLSIFEHIKHIVNCCRGLWGVRLEVIQNLKGLPEKLTTDNLIHIKIDTVIVYIMSVIHHKHHIYTILF